MTSLSGSADPSQIAYDPPTLEPILKDTYGVIVYQEQVMAIANKIAGFSAGPSRPPASGHGQKETRRNGETEVLFIEGAKDSALLGKKSGKTLRSHGVFCRLRI